uniref:A4_EXTRA domain-containing protein n=2 Tax=Macrostomum lignano TaxID=282301 RepID=A0A1I8J0B8_9PLAT
QQQQQQQHQHQVAFACPTDSAENTDDLPAVVWLSDPAGGPGRWHADPRLTGCPATPSKQLEFCRLAYPHVKNIINVAPAAETVPVPNWCPSGSSALDCPARTVTPQLCLTSDFKSDALLLPPNCRFDHRSADNPRNPDECRTFTQWRQVARARCASVGEVLRTHSLLLPCSAAGKFAGVEFVCCPETSAVPFAVPSVEDRDREIVQRYLALPTQSSASESERYSQASGSLNRINQASEARLESQMSSEENRVLDQRRSSASRLVSDILNHYRRAYESLQRQESSERQQLESVHEDRLSDGVSANLQRLRQLLSNALDAGKSSQAVGYLRELGRMTAAEATRLANQAVTMATNNQLTDQRLDSAKQRLKQLRQQFDDARKRLPASEASADHLDDFIDSLRHADLAIDRLKPSRSPSSVDEAALAARFAEILRRHAERDRRRLEQQQKQQQQPERLEDHLALMEHPHSAVGGIPSHVGAGRAVASSSAALSGILGGLATLLIIG